MTRFYITTAIDYVNSRPHLGTAYEKVCADVIARYKRLSGFDTFFLMGNDEHSQNVYKSAMEQGLDPLAYCDRMEEMFQKTWRSARSVVRRFHPDDAADGIKRRSPSWCSGSTTPATSTKACTRAGTASGAKPSSPRKSS